VCDTGTPKDPTVPIQSNTTQSNVLQTLDAGGMVAPASYLHKDFFSNLTFSVNVALYVVRYLGYVASEGAR
jgi:hypothetical protein